jgi:hypothetical protein
MQAPSSSSIFRRPPVEESQALERGLLAGRMAAEPSWRFPAGTFFYFKLNDKIKRRHHD